MLRIWSERLGGRDKLVQRLIQEIVASGADSIVTFDPRHGSTCHPDHRAIGLLVAEAVASMGNAAPRTYLLTTRVIVSSGLDGSESVQFLQVDQEGELELRYNADLRWHSVTYVAEIHRSQFSPSMVGALSRVPTADQVVGVIQLEAVRSLTERDVCQAPGSLTVTMKVGRFGVFFHSEPLQIRATGDSDRRPLLPSSGHAPARPRVPAHVCAVG